MLTVNVVLVLAAFLVTIGAAIPRVGAPLWVAVLLLVVLELVRLLPLR